MPTGRTVTFLAFWLFASAAAEGSAGDNGCIDITPYAINPENLGVLKGGGDIPNDVAVYFEFPATTLAGPAIFCLEDILIPDTVGGRNCTGYDACQMTVGKRVHPDDGKRDEAFSLSDYQCLCEGFSVRPDDPATVGTPVSGCGLADGERWGAGCSDAALASRSYYDGNGTRVISNKSTAYVSLCPPNGDRCRVCNNGGGSKVMPRFVAGVQWVSNIRDQCLDDPFVSYRDYSYSNSGGGMSTGSATGIAVAVGVVLFLAVQAARRRRQRTKERFEENDAEKGKRLRGRDEDEEEERESPGSNGDEKSNAEEASV